MTSTTTSSIGETLDSLASIIAERKDADITESYTARLLTGHEDKLLKKIGEEATEVVMAAKDKDKGQIIYETGDLFYHLLVVLERYGVSLEDISAELSSRMK